MLMRKVILTAAALALVALGVGTTTRWGATAHRGPSPGNQKNDKESILVGAAPSVPATSRIAAGLGAGSDGSLPAVEGTQQRRDLLAAAQSMLAAGADDFSGAPLVGQALDEQRRSAREAAGIVALELGMSKGEAAQLVQVVEQIHASRRAVELAIVRGGLSAEEASSARQLENEKSLARFMGVMGAKRMAQLDQLEQRQPYGSYAMAGSVK